MSASQPATRLTLPEALRALPLVRPEREVWNELAARLQAEARSAPPAARIARRRRLRYVVPAALAAGVALVAFEAHRAPAPPTAPATVAAPAASPSTGGAMAAHDANNAANATNATNQPNDTAARIAALEQRSDALERWLQETGAAAPLSGQDLAAAAEIENLIGVVDVALAAPQAQQTEALWRRRVDLLEDLTALRYSSYRLAATSAAGAANDHFID
jgi:hypothetical protein